MFTHSFCLSSVCGLTRTEICYDNTDRRQMLLLPSWAPVVGLCSSLSMLDPSDVPFCSAINPKNQMDNKSKLDQCSMSFAIKLQQSVIFTSVNPVKPVSSFLNFSVYGLTVICHVQPCFPKMLGPCVNCEYNMIWVFVKQWNAVFNDTQHKDNTRHQMPQRRNYIVLQNF